MIYFVYKNTDLIQSQDVLHYTVAIFIFDSFHFVHLSKCKQDVTHATLSIDRCADIH